MPNFKYKALSSDGTAQRGVVEAYDEFEAVDLIRQGGRVVTSIAEVDSPDRVSLLRRDLGSPMVSDKLLALMCAQFTIVLRAGMPIVRTVKLIAGQTGDKSLRRLLLQVAEDVAAGHSLAQSFENKGKKNLPGTFIDTVRAGEESGTLESVFARLETYYDKSAKTKARVRGAMIYPAFLMGLAVVVIAIVLGVAMPVFIQMFDASGQELPAVTRVLIALSRFFERWWLAVLAALAALAMGLKLWSNKEKGRLFFARLQLRLPALGSVARMKGASQFANTMATLLAAGMPILRALSVCAKTLDNYHLSTRLGMAAAGLEEGRTLGRCLEQSGVFPDLLVEMTAVGEESGMLEGTLDTIGAYYDAETELASQKALALLQPAITVFMGVVIGFVVIALYLPMFTMYG